MKKTLFLLLAACGLTNYASAQTIVYEIPFSQLVGMELTTGDVCSNWPNPPEEARQVAIGNQWGCTWTSTGTGSVSTVTVDFGFTLNDQINIITLLNGFANNGQVGTPINCTGGTIPMSWSVDPTNYVVGGVNTFLIDYAASSQINQIDHLIAGSPDIYMTVTVEYEACQPPVIALDEGTNATCNGDSDGAIDISVTGGNMPYVYDWDSGQTTQDISGLPAGTYTVVVTEDNGCTDTLSYTVTEPAAIDVSVSQVGAAFSANATGVSYQWIDCSDSSAIAGETNQMFTATANGDYAVIITDGPCSDTSVCYNVSNISVGELEGLNLEIFPNPSDGKIFITSNADISLANVEVYDISMKLIQSTQTSLIAGQAFELDLTEVEKGVYLVRLTDLNNQSSGTMKITIE